MRQVWMRGLVRRLADRERGGIILLASLGGVATVSTLTNPLYTAWATVPLVVVLVMETAGKSAPRRTLKWLVVLMGGTALGFLLRILFGAWIANTGAGYARPDQWAPSVTYYTDLLADRLSTPLGLVGCALTV